MDSQYPKFNISDVIANLLMQGRQTTVINNLLYIWQNDFRFYKVLEAYEFEEPIEKSDFEKAFQRIVEFPEHYDLSAAYASYVEEREYIRKSKIFDETNKMLFLSAVSLCRDFFFMMNKEEIKDSDIEDIFVNVSKHYKYLLN